MFRIAACCLAALATVAASFGATAQTEPLRVTIAPGQSPQQAMRDARLVERVAKLRADWAARAAGDRTLAPTYALPKITAGALLTTSLNVQVALPAPKLSVSFRTDAPSLSFIAYEFTASSANQYLYSEYISPQPLTKGTLILQAPNGGAYIFYGGILGLYAAPGTWSLTFVFLCDTAGDCQEYDGTALAAIFKRTRFTVTNRGTPDTTPPKVSSGKILTPKVSLSAANPAFRAQLGVADNLSGVEYPLVFINPTGTGHGNADEIGTPYPLLSGTAVAVDHIAKNDPHRDLDDLRLRRLRRR